MKPSLGMLAASAMAAAVMAGCTQAPMAEQAAANPNATQQPVVNFASCQRPVYPPQALADKIEGTSTIGFLVGPDGKVIASKVYTSSGNASLDEAARSAISQCTFRPPSHKGKPAQAWIPVQYVWKMD